MHLHHLEQQAVRIVRNSLDNPRRVSCAPPRRNSFLAESRRDTLFSIATGRMDGKQSLMATSNCSNRSRRFELFPWSSVRLVADSAMISRRRENEGSKKNYTRQEKFTNYPTWKLQSRSSLSIKCYFIRKLTKFS
ncbi:unnamed protein product [Xylocopa violacea]|uniref:Uncharacterized protein n=1 Tax=Xylocopa violacea TaxID=135666 RepID=A0ABP1PIV2_XYLVO